MPPLSARTGAPRCLVVFKFQGKWANHLIRKLSLVYQVDHVFAGELLYSGGSAGLVRCLNEIIVAHDINVVFFDADFFPSIDFAVIDGVSSAVKKVLLTFDDLILHDVNCINASACDAVLTADPVSVLRYQEKGVPAHYLTLEASPDLYFDRGLARDIDVLFFGHLGKADRKTYIDYLRERGISVKTIGVGSEYVTEEVLAEYIARAKMVVDFSKTDFLSNVEIPTTHVYPFYYQLKGRAIECGLSHTPCVSEYSPALALLFNRDEVPTFTNKEECYTEVTKLLSSEQERRNLADRLSQKVRPSFADDVQMRQVCAFIDSVPKAGPRSLRIPHEYLLMVLKARLWILAKRPGVLLREFIGFSMSYPSAGALCRAHVLLQVLLWMPILVSKKLSSMLARPGSPIKNK